MSKLSRIGLFVLTLMITTAVYAQPGQRAANGEARLEGMLERLQEAAQLSDERIDQLRPIFEEQHEQRRELFRQHDWTDREALRAAMDALQLETDARVAELLSEEEMERYTEWMESRDRRRPRRGGRR